jgi:hypothetical protein
LGSQEWSGGRRGVDLGGGVNFDSFRWCDKVYVLIHIANFVTNFMQVFGGTIFEGLKNGLRKIKNGFNKLWLNWRGLTISGDRFRTDTARHFFPTPKSGGPKSARKMSKTGSLSSC